jgi:hypothetical protein
MTETIEKTKEKIIKLLTGASQIGNSTKYLRKEVILQIQGLHLQAGIRNTTGRKFHTDNEPLKESADRQPIKSFNSKPLKKSADRQPIKADNGVTVITLINTVCENRFATDKMPSCL